MLDSIITHKQLHVAMMKKFHGELLTFNIHIFAFLHIKKNEKNDIITASNKHILESLAFIDGEGKRNKHNISSKTTMLRN